mmetsp:Transcript_45839/g.111072  ORF Transcript_45839/g.111072 Transcript_45839/m.111072 type:complete len:82 (-) Transcript_45839:156-401(-)
MRIQTLRMRANPRLGLRKEKHPKTAYLVIGRDDSFIGTIVHRMSFATRELNLEILLRLKKWSCKHVIAQALERKREVDKNI